MTDPIRISDDQHNNAPAVPQGWTDADSDAARLALELECLLMDTKDLSVVSKWWGSANDALELHRQRLAATPAPAPAQEPETALQKFTRFKVAETEGNPVEMLRAFCAFAMNSQDWFDVEPFFDLVREAMASRTAVAPAQEVVMPTDKQIIQAMTAEFPTPSLVPMLKGSVICGDFHKALVSAVNVGIAEFCRINGIGQPAQEVGLIARQFDLICQAIDKADTATMEGDYMLDSDDCINVIRVMQALFDVTKPAQEVRLTDEVPAHVAWLLEHLRELDAIEFFESTNRDSHKFKKSVRGTYVNPAVARDWKWFQLGMKHATEDES